HLTRSSDHYAKCNNVSTLRPLHSSHVNIQYIFFFIQSSGNHRDLHSFPTRRSSDLSTCSRTRAGRPRRTHARAPAPRCDRSARADRKSTRLNSSHVAISYAVFCLKKKKSPRKSSLLLMKSSPHCRSTRRTVCHSSRD